jgi:hypothetical protein
MRCNLVDKYKHFIRNCYLNHSGEDVADAFFAMLVSPLADTLSPKPWFLVPWQNHISEDRAIKHNSADSWQEMGLARGWGSCEVRLWDTKGKSGSMRQKKESRVRIISCAVYQYLILSLNMTLTCIKSVRQIANSNGHANPKKTFCKKLYLFLFKNPEVCTINFCQKRTAYFKPTLSLKYVGRRISFTHQ